MPEPRGESAVEGDAQVKSSERIVGFPTIGMVDADLLASALGELGLRVQKPLPITSNTIKLGVRHSSDMICYPYKITLGSLIESLEIGANTLLQYTAGKGTLCRQKQFYRLQEHTLRRLGYEFEMIGVSIFNVIPTMARLSGKSIWKTWRVVSRYRRLIEKREHHQKAVDGRLNIAIIGEIYCCCDDRVNRGLVGKVRACGANPINTATVSEFCRTEEAGFWSGTLFRNARQRFAREADRYFEGKFAGHARENVANLLRVIEEGIDGVIHVMPLSCMPECTIEAYVDSICESADVPLLRIPIDENDSDVAVSTRIETFVELIQCKRDGLAAVSQA